MSGIRCPKCGDEGDKNYGLLIQQGPIEGIRSCPECEFMWGNGTTPGRGIEWWSEKSGWIRAPEGCMTVMGD